jgi:hypothetical protein
LRARAADAVVVTALAAIVTLIMAAPVLRAPSERLFGMDSVGRHHDPFTVMGQLAQPAGHGVYAQPATDVPGRLLARLAGPVAGYNWLVLLTFPLSAATAYLLARYLTLSRWGAAVAALAYAFSPFHLAQAAYHPHIAQTQWMPLYLLALWHCLDRASPAAVGALAAATMAVTFSNYYGGLIAAVLAPAAVAGYFLTSRAAHPRPLRRLAITVGSLLALAATGLAYAWLAADAVIANPAAFAFPRADLFLYGAKWWSYLMPPIAHPLLGDFARRVWHGAGVREGLLEQQVSLGWGIVGLGVVAISWWLGADKRPASRTRVPLIVVVAVVALLCSLSPERTIGSVTFVRPSSVLYDVVPMFRSYARFGMVVQLMAALLAGIGVDRLVRAGTTPAFILAIGLVALAAAEYAAVPSTLWRDPLPTTAHRWMVQQRDPVRAVDCVPLDQESESVRWLTGDRVAMLGGAIDDCAEPNLSEKLAAHGYTHLLVRHDRPRHAPAAGRVPEGLRVAARFADADVFAVVAAAPAIYTAATTGFSAREHDTERSWQWMGGPATWTVINTGPRLSVANLALEVAAFHRPRQLHLRLDGTHVQTLVVEPSRRVHQIGPLALAPGAHLLVFQPTDPPTVAGDVIHNGDRRPLSFAIGTWRWTVRGEQP